MRSFRIITLLIILFMLSVGIFILVWGMNRVSTNMNNAYSSGSGNALLLEPSNRDKTESVKYVIPVFMEFGQPKAYTYRLVIMGKGIQVDVKGVVDCFKVIKDGAGDLLNI